MTISLLHDRPATLPEAQFSMPFAVGYILAFGKLGSAMGMTENPLSDDALSEKFRACTAFAGWPDDKAEMVLAHLWDIENAGDIKALVRGDG